MFKPAILAAALLLAAIPALAQMPGFHPGPVFKTFGPIADVDSDMPIHKGTVFKVSFDVSEQAPVASFNKHIEAAARFVNLQAAAGVPVADIHVAVVVHGKAAFDLLKSDAYAARNDGKPNAGAAAVTEMIAHGVDIYLCGQTAAGLQIKKSELLPGVKMALSAMTAQALLQQQGYTLNPF